MRQLDGARDARAEADAVVGSVDVVVHRLRDGDDVHPFIVQPLAVAQRVVAADGNQHVDADVLEILQHVLRDVVDLGGVPGRVCGHALARQMARPGARGVQERAAGASGAIHIGFRQLLDVPELSAALSGT